MSPRVAVLTCRKQFSLVKTRSKALRPFKPVLFPVLQVLEHSLQSDHSSNLQSTGQPWALQTISSDRGKRGSMRIYGNALF